MSREVTINQKVIRASLWIFVGLLAYTPLHIFLSTWLGTSFGVLPLAKVAKDIVLVWGAGLALAAYVTKYGRRDLMNDKLLWLIGGYATLTLLLAAIRPTGQSAEAIGIVYNLRFLVFFVYGLLLTRLVDMRELRRKSFVAVFASALIVLAFGVLQYTVLPNDALGHVGYKRANGVLPVFFIDEKPDLERVMSTQRDPNSFGSYVLIIVGLVGALWIRGKQYRKFARGYILLSGLCLWFTFSRSAWLGAIVTVGMLFALAASRDKRIMKHSKKILIAALMLVILGCGTLFALRNTYLVQNVILHADQSTVLEDPNQLRVRFFRESITRIVHNPLGSGPGTAGLASIRNDVQGVQLNEDYYLQIATEVGLVGLVLFLAIVGMVAWRLWFRAQQGDWLAVGLLASLAGLMLTNLLVHIWSTEAVAYTWWGLAPLTLIHSHQQTTKQTQKPTRMKRSTSKI